ncbi:hypothetical protein L6R29_21845 [Myxococcota bacterium]|nr:hypothetical protein [Myxococcota bacterium]
MDVMRCDAMVRRIDRIVDGEASWSERLGFYFHMAICWKCRRYLRQFRQMRLLVGQIQEEMLPEDFAQVMGRALALGGDRSEQGLEVDDEGVWIGRPVWITKR